MMTTKNDFSSMTMSGSLNFNPTSLDCGDVVELHTKTL